MRDDTLWQTVLGEVELTVSRGSYITWFKNTRVLRRSEEMLVVGVPNIFAKQQLELKYKPMILELFKKTEPATSMLSLKYTLALYSPKRSKIIQR